MAKKHFSIVITQLYAELGQYFQTVKIDPDHVIGRDDHQCLNECRICTFRCRIREIMNTIYVRRLFVSNVPLFLTCYCQTYQYNIT